GVLLLDVTPLSLGIETLGGVFTKLIPANTTIPTKKSEIFSTATDNQPSVEIHVLQGERAMAADNRTLGRFHLDGIPPARRGTPQIEVTFDIDANGILNVTAKDKATNREQKIRIEASSGLSQAEIDRMKREAEANAEADRKRREEADKLNEADSLIFNTENQLKDYGDKLSANNRSAIESALNQLREAHRTRNIPGIDSAMNALKTAWQNASQEMYQAAGGQNNPNPDYGHAKSNNEPNVADVEYEEVKDDKR
ncbi:MAG: Hsp70 family protein, partial [Bacteroidia bacterium]|nr:Hsp70 family protein [Bacteroidia bacterium]